MIVILCTGSLPGRAAATKAAEEDAKSIPKPKDAETPPADEAAAEATEGEAAAEVEGDEVVPGVM